MFYFNTINNNNNTSNNHNNSTMYYSISQNHHHHHRHHHRVVLATFERSLVRGYVSLHSHRTLSNVHILIKVMRP